MAGLNPSRFTASEILEKGGVDLKEADEAELRELHEILEDLVQQNPESPCIKEIYSLK